jgi:transaldolase
MQLEALKDVLDQSHIVSVFAGRIADTGRDPAYMMRFARRGHAQLLWASAREVLNVSQADECGCDIITLTPDLIAKLDLHGKSLAEYSLETVKAFYEDGKDIAF